MPRLEWSERALSDLDQLVLSHHLPADTRERIEDSAQPLERFPRLGPEIRALPAGGELRFLIGPWPWLVIVYLYLEAEDRVGVVSIEDGRAASSATTSVERCVSRSFGGSGRISRRAELRPRCRASGSRARCR